MFCKLRFNVILPWDPTSKNSFRPTEERHNTAVRTSNVVHFGAARSASLYTVVRMRTCLHFFYLQCTKLLSSELFFKTASVSISKHCWTAMSGTEPKWHVKCTAGVGNPQYILADIFWLYKPPAVSIQHLRHVECRCSWQLCTGGLTNLHGVLHVYSTLFKWLPEQSWLPYVIKKLVFITEMQCVYCEAGAVTNIIGATSNIFGNIFQLLPFPCAGCSIIPLVELLFLYQLGYHIFNYQNALIKIQ